MPPGVSEAQCGDRTCGLFVTFSPMDTPPEVMMTSARLMPSFRALRRSSGLWGTSKHTHDVDYKLTGEEIMERKGNGA